MLLFALNLMFCLELLECSNYDAYMADLTLERQLAKEAFLRENPRGHIVLERLSSPEYRKRHPILGDLDSENPDIDDQQWMNFLQELSDARSEAASPDWNPGPGGENVLYGKEEPEYSIADYSNYTDQQAVNPRKPEVPYQNTLWGVHKVTGGSGEVGKWLDYALLGAGAQDEEEFDDEISPLIQDDFDRGSILKNDSLPAYCDPPNPCPIGYDPDTLTTPCDAHTAFTEELNRMWILSKVANGECSCDTEHMNTCQLGSRNEIDEMERLKKFDMKPSRPNPYLAGQRRKRLVAKKAFSNKPSRPNPYLAGQRRKRLVAKKAFSNKHHRNYYMQGKVLKKVVKKNGHQMTSIKQR